MTLAGRTLRAREAERMRRISAALLRHDAIVRLRREEDARERADRLRVFNARFLQIRTRRAAAQKMLLEAPWTTGPAWAAEWAA